MQRNAYFGINNMQTRHSKPKNRQNYFALLQPYWSHYLLINNLSINVMGRSGSPHVHPGGSFGRQDPEHLNQQRVPTMGTNNQQRMPTEPNNLLVK